MTTLKYVYGTVGMVSLYIDGLVQDCSSSIALAI